MKLNIKKLTNTIDATAINMLFHVYYDNSLSHKLNIFSNLSLFVISLAKTKCTYLPTSQ